MKKIFYYLVLSLTLFGWVGCSEDTTSEASWLEIIEAELNFTAAGGEGHIGLKSNSSAISVESDLSWVQFTHIASDKITFLVAENPKAVLRSADIIIKAGNTQKTLSVVQEGALFHIEEEFVELASEGDTLTIPFHSSIASAPEVILPADCEWLTATADSEGLTLTAAANFETDREVVVGIRVGWKEAIELPVKQSIVDFFARESVTVDREIRLGENRVEGTKYLPLLADWRVEVAEGDWLSVEKIDSKSLYLNTLQQNASSKEREARVHLMSASGEVVDQLIVKQKSWSREFFLGEWKMNYGENQQAVVTLTQHAEDLAAGKSLAEANRFQLTGLTAGYATPALTLLYKEDENGAVLTLNCNAVELGNWSDESNGTNQPCYLYASDRNNTPYADEGAAWLLKFSASDLKTLTWEQNDALKSVSNNISGFVVVADNGSKLTPLAGWPVLTTCQRDATPVNARFEISGSTVELPAEGGKVEIPYQNAHFEPTVEQTEVGYWLTATVDTERGVVILEAPFNYVGTRSTTITVASGPEQVTIPVKQYMIPVFDVNEVIVDSGAHSRVAEVKVTENVKYVSANSSWSVESGNEWLTVEKSTTGEGFVVSVEANTTGKRRTGGVNLLTREGKVVATMPVYQHGFNMSTIRGTYRLYYDGDQVTTIEIRRHEHDIRDGVAIENCNRLEIRNLFHPNNKVVFPWITIFYNSVGESVLSFDNGQKTSNWRYTVDEVRYYTDETYLCPITGDAMPQAMVFTEANPSWEFLIDLDESETTLQIEPSAWLKEQDPTGKYTGFGYISKKANTPYHSSWPYFCQQADYAIWDYWRNLDRLEKISTPSQEELNTTW